MAKDKDDYGSMSHVDEAPEKKVKVDTETPAYLSAILFKHVPKPQDFSRVRSINVFDNRWRINVYAHCKRHGIRSEVIAASYFVTFDKDTKALRFVLPKL